MNNKPKLTGRKTSFCVHELDNGKIKVDLVLADLSKDANTLFFCMSRSIQIFAQLTSNADDFEWFAITASNYLKNKSRRKH